MKDNIYCDLLQEISEKMGCFSSYNDELSIFNIFKVLGIENKEVLICRLIGELLDPNGTHELEYKPLESFLNIIGCSEHFSSDDLKSAIVNLEEVIDAERRIDIVIYIKDYIIPIEVKIWANDQENQLQDYYKYFDDRGKYGVKYIYYLTPHGRLPSQYSYGNLPIDKIQCLSFVEHVSKWLTDISKAISKNHRVLTILEQLKEVIIDMSKEDEILQNIISVLNLEESHSFKDNERIQALLYILNSQEMLWKKIRNTYLRNQLEPQVESQLKGYRLKDYSTNEKKDYCVFEISNMDKTIAQICVETNLYIVAKKIKPNDVKYWKEGDGWWWRYLSPGIKNNKKIQMNVINTKAIDAILSNSPIHIEEILNQIDIDFDVEK